MAANLFLPHDLPSRFRYFQIGGRCTHGFSARSARSSFFLDSPALTVSGDAETGNQRPGVDDLTEQVASLGGSVSIYSKGEFGFRKVDVRARTMPGNITLGYRYARNNKSDPPRHATPRLSGSEPGNKSGESEWYD